MTRLTLSSPSSWVPVLVSVLAIFGTLIPSAHADDSGVLSDTSNPSLYTGDFGDCLGGDSLLNVTAFDAAYYADELAVLFHLTGTTNLKNESVVLYIQVEAYGQQRFSLAFNPCSANIESMCPMNASVPITAEAVIPVSPSDVSGIPPIALHIPDFEGSAQLLIFANSTQTEIGCFQAVMKNGATFSHPAAVGSTLGIFTIVAIVASFATVIYGASAPQIRTHYAHSLSVLVVFEVFQSIFFSGALSLNWPSVCAAFWSNFAWSAGLIYSSSMVASVNKFVGVNGNSSQVGGAGSTVLNNNGGLQQQIFGRSLSELSTRTLQEVQRRSEIANRIYRRATESNSTETPFPWAGNPVDPGIVIPGNWSGFSGTLSEINIPAADAFMTGFLWFLILLVLLVGAILLFKGSLELFITLKWMQPDRLTLFRSHWLGFLCLIILRSVFIAFSMMMILTLFQFAYGGTAGVIAIAAIIFLTFFAGILGLAFYACFARLRFGKYESSPDRIYFQRKKGTIPKWTTIRESKVQDSERANVTGSIPFFRVEFIDNDQERQTVHEDADYNKRFGWLSARYRRTRWWFFAIWVVYQFVRACFIGGARAHPTAQVYGLFIVEIIALIIIVRINPFEGQRNTVLAVYMLGISKVATAGLSIAFLPQYNVERIPTTVVGIIIIVIQGLLTIGVLVLIVMGAISTHMSLTRNRDSYKPKRLEGIRRKYLEHIERKAADLPPPPPPEPEEPKEPHFNVLTVRRAPKIEDEDIDMLPEMDHPAAQPTFSLGNRARTNSVAKSARSNYSGNVPYGARVHRPSWSSRDFENWQQQELANARGIPLDGPSRASSRNVSGHNTANNSVSMSGASMAHLVQPVASYRSLNSSAPTKEQQ